MKAVIDTNVWLDWLVFGDRSSEALAVAHSDAALELPATVAIRAELEAVLKRPLFGLDAAARQAVVARFDACAALLPAPEIATLPARLPICRDPDDRKFVELALASRADFLVSRDKAVLKLARQALRWHGLAIVHPESASWQQALCGAQPAPIASAPVQTL